VTFAHDDSGWEGLLAIVSDAAGRQAALVEKDYRVAHTLWALHEQGFDLWFKGRTSLSKRSSGATAS
jgi:predicted nucleotidyltransferase component of viral defense system